jgi:itaconyl-CoA hydratase
MDRYGYAKVGANRYREEKGFYYEDFVLGVVIEHRPGRTVTEVDNIWQNLLSMNQHPLHIDAKYASQTEFGKLLVSSLITFNIVNGMTVHTISQKAIANLGWEKVRLNAPVFVGDTLYAETKIVSKRESKTRSADGIVEVDTLGFNQHGTQVIEFRRQILIPKRGQAQ